MADTGHPRRQPPSPLIFSPETVLSPPNTGIHGSGSNTVSMPFVRRHVTRRLKAAKADCDKELLRVTNSITAFFEDRLRDGDMELDNRDRESLASDLDHIRDGFVFHPADLRSALQADESSSDGGYDAELEFGSRHSRQPSTTSSPGSLRRQQSGTPWDSSKPMSASLSSSAISSSPAHSTIMLPEAPITRKQPAPGAPPSWNNQSGIASRRLSRTIHIPSRPSHSGRSSRSTSRSRSPLPPHHGHSSFSDYPASAGPSGNRRTSRILVDDPVDPIMAALYEIIAVATDITDMSITQLSSQPKVCASFVQRIQNIGKVWDEHPDWHGRNWYVQVLLAVASLSRVVEWWEAEKQFWNFDDNDDELDEPLTFVMKPADDFLAPPVSFTKRGEMEHVEPLHLNDHNKLKIARTVSQPRRSRDDHQKELSASSLPDAPSRTPSKIQSTESARVLATERLRLQAETAQNQNMVMELSLDGDHFIWINYAWSVVVGSDPDALSGTRISVLLYPADAHVFREATQRLLEDDSHTVEARFRLRVELSDDRDHHPSQTLYREMEGKGMLMIDREDGAPSHTMWVVKPIAPPQLEADVGPELVPIPDDSNADVSITASLEPSFIEGRWTEAETALPFNQPICTDPILCQICENPIPQWYFEKHSETCAETHRLEAEIMECNESIEELRNTIRDLGAAIDRTSPGPVPEYRGMQLFSPSTSPVATSPLQLFRANKMQRIGVKKMQRRLLDQLEDILQVAAEITVPSLKEDEAKEPIERQRLLSPTSERKMSQVKNWSKPQTEDGTLGQLVQDAERVMRQKIDNVVRMQNTIRYAEKIWTEWEEKVSTYLAASAGDSASESGSDEHHLSADEDYQGGGDDHSSTKSEYAFTGEAQASNRASILVEHPDMLLEPRPSFDLAPTLLPAIPHATTPPESRPPSALQNLPSRQALQTRSSTPSSVSSPLALAAPIVAPPAEVPAMSLENDTGSSKLQARKSTSSLLEPSLSSTPPTSPMMSAHQGPALQRDTSTRRGQRRHSTVNSSGSPSGPLSPRQPSAAPLARAAPPSIKDFEIIKPISKGAFGSVFLAKKKVTGHYYAIKVLKKADMIAKNQITNVKAERMILMKQSESPFVAKLFFTFQSKDNLYLVMEYLNGGDCAALIKSLGSLPEEWTKNYVAEVTLGLEYLHSHGIIHRDLKPDNLLIDQHGHLKLTDFGLSRIGLLGRQTRESQIGRPHTRYHSRSRPPSMDSAYLSSPLIFADASAGGGSYFNQRTPPVPRLSSPPYLPSTDDLNDANPEGYLTFHSRRGKSTESPMQSFATELTTELRSHSNSNSTAGGTPPGEQKFVGTPDYLAPETILGLGDDAAVDWWALGVITYEFLYGIPPFHADTPEKVFENILSGDIEWHEEWVDFSEEARDFMMSLMTVDPTIRLGVRGADEVKSHPFFEDIEWDKVTSTEAAFIPQVTDPESTMYFDPRGAIHQLFHDDDQIVAQATLNSPILDSSMPPPQTVPIPINNSEALTSPPMDESFGSFSYKNLPVLKQANDDVIRKLKTDQMVPLTQALAVDSPGLHSRKKSTSQRVKKPPSLVTSIDPKTLTANPPSPATSNSSIASSPSRTSLPPSAPGSAGHNRKPSEYNTVERFKLSHLDGVERRNSMPSRLRTASVSSAGDGSGSETWNSSIGHGSSGTAPSSVHSIDLKKGPDPTDRAVTCLLAEDNPITAKILETLLIRLGCRCVVVADGSEAISVAMGDIKFDCILMDLYMPVLDGEGAARYIKSTNSKNTNTPIVCVSAYSGAETEASNVFAASLSKPVQKADLLAVMRQLGFRTTTFQGGPGTKVTAQLMT